MTSFGLSWNADASKALLEAIHDNNGDNSVNSSTKPYQLYLLADGRLSLLDAPAADVAW